MDFIDIDPSKLSAPVSLAIALVIIGRALKCSPIKDWLIPWICLLLGAIGLPLLAGKWDANNIVGGLIVAGAVVGLWATTRQSLVKRVQDAGGVVNPLVGAILGKSDSAKEPARELTENNIDKTGE